MKNLEKIIHNCINILKQPNVWIDTLHSNRKNVTWLFLAIVIFMILGITLDSKWHFPYFEIFVLCFNFIGFLGLWAIAYFSKKMESITASVSIQPSARKANLFYFRYCVNSHIYIICPFTIILIFCVGGCSMFGAIEITPTLIWILLLFSFVVYISIIGYLQYIVLAIYIRNLAHGSGEFRQLTKSMIECIPAQIDWLQKLTKLSHTYRSVFFTLGSVFIIAYGAFCWLPNMQANTESISFFLLWGIIFIAIVIVFPITSLVEYQWIKIIVEQLKVCYIKDLMIECNIKQKSKVTQLAPNFERLVQTLCATQILNSRDYPFKSVFTTVYATVFSLFNFAATIITVAQGIPIFTIVLRHLF